MPECPECGAGNALRDPAKPDLVLCGLCGWVNNPDHYCVVCGREPVEPLYSVDGSEVACVCGDCAGSGADAHEDEDEDEGGDWYSGTDHPWDGGCRFRSAGGELVDPRTTFSEWLEASPYDGVGELVLSAEFGDAVEDAPGDKEAMVVSLEEAGYHPSAEADLAADGFGTAVVPEGVFRKPMGSGYEAALAVPKEGAPVLGWKTPDEDGGEPDRSEANPVEMEASGKADMSSLFAPPRQRKRDIERRLERLENAVELSWGDRPNGGQGDG